MTNQEDGRFGRVIVQFRTPTGETRLAVSRTLFADSYYAAMSAVWGGHSGATAFRPGEILVLMSMDPFADFEEDVERALEERVESLRQRAATIPETDVAAMEAIFIELQQIRADVPRRLVFHPSVYGRELAWSAARIDFSFNDVPGLSHEASITNGGTPMPAQFLTIDVSEANTWQFFELDADIQLAGTSSSGRSDMLQVVSRGSAAAAGSPRSHFSLSMFAVEPSESPDEEGEATLLPELAEALQPMLDWLAVNHHDFVRLNDMSESFSLLRWMHGHGVAPVLIDMDGEEAEIATPDRILFSTGPRIGK